LGRGLVSTATLEGLGDWEAACPRAFVLRKDRHVQVAAKISHSRRKFTIYAFPLTSAQAGGSLSHWMYSRINLLKERMSSGCTLALQSGQALSQSPVRRPLDALNPPGIR